MERITISLTMRELLRLLQSVDNNCWYELREALKAADADDVERLINAHLEGRGM